MSVITDFYSVVLPAVLLLRIKMTKRQKIGLVFIFGLGFLYVFSFLAPYSDVAQLHVTLRI
jgi:hypothetical protein